MESTEIKSHPSTPTESSDDQEIDSGCVIIDLSAQGQGNFGENVVTSADINNIYQNINQYNPCRPNESYLLSVSRQLPPQEVNQGSTRRIKLACACTVIWVSICLSAGALFYKFYLN